MNSRQWIELNRKVKDEFEKYQDARRKGISIRNLKRLCELVVDALRIAGILSKPINRKKYPLIFEYRNDLDGRVLELGPAVVLLSDLPDPASLPEADCAALYMNLLRGAIDSRAPVDLFILAFNYTNKLLDRFQDKRYFLDSASLEELELDLRKRLITHECAQCIMYEDEEENPLVRAYRQSIRRVADTYMRNGDYAGCIGSLLREFERRYTRIQGVSEPARYEVLFWTHYYNRLLGILPSEELPIGFQKVKHQLEHWQVQRIEEFENPDVESVDLRSMHIHPTEGYIPRDATTGIFLTIPTKIPEGVFRNDECEIRIEAIRDPFVDPNFLFLHRQPIVLNGMPLAILSPAIASDNDAKLIEISIPKPFHPGIELDENRSVVATHINDFKRIHGQDFDPFLAKAVGALMEVRETGWPSREELVSSLRNADSYTVGYFSLNGDQTFHFFQPLVRLSTFVAARSLFLQRFRRATTEGKGSERLKKLLFQSASLDALQLQRFAKEVILQFIAIPSERGEWWKTVWKEGSNYSSVRPEPNVARDIYNVIAPWFKVKGLTLDREVSAAGGSIDMLAASALDSQIHRCGIEVKFAHNDRIIQGISAQLPGYMSDLEAETGLFVSIWCKGKGFVHPAKYSDASDLEKELTECAPKTMSIDIINIDASFRPSPSKRN